jgi:protein-arginine kinase activator protein McsA
MAFSPHGGPPAALQPFDAKAGRILPHEFSKQVALAVESFRCDRCGATADQTTIGRDGYAYCYAGHRHDVGEVFGATHARVMEANRRLGRKV